MRPNIIQACKSRDLFAPWFKRPETWRNWFTFLRALFGLKMSAADLATFAESPTR